MGRAGRFAVAGGRLVANGSGESGGAELWSSALGRSVDGINAPQQRHVNQVKRDSDADGDTDSDVDSDTP